MSLNQKYDFDFQGEPGEKGGIGSIGPRVWMFRIFFSVSCCVFASTQALPHLLFLFGMLNNVRISSVSENTDGAYLNKSLCRYQILPLKMALGNTVKSHFLFSVTIQ